MLQPLTTLKTESYYIIKIISIKNIDFVPTKTDISFFSPITVKSVIKETNAWIFLCDEDLNEPQLIR